MVHLWVGGALRDPPPSFLPPSGSSQPWGSLSLGGLSSKRMAPASPLISQQPRFCGTHLKEPYLFHSGFQQNLQGTGR